MSAHPVERKYREPSNGAPTGGFDGDAFYDPIGADMAAAEAQPVGEPFGYVITNNVPESSPYRHVFYRPSEISAAYKDNALYSTPVYTAPPEWLSRFHHLMKKHGLHPGRTDDDLLDILDAHLSAAPPAQPAAQPLTDAWRQLYRRAINEANGLTNYVEDRPELRSAERRISKIEDDARTIWSQP